MMEADSIETSLAILQTLWNDGVDVVCATSHYYRERETVEEFVERRSRSAASLRKAIRKVTKEGQESMAGNGLPVFFAGAETAFFSGISECDRLNDLCMEGTRTLMLEMPFREWTGMEHGEVISLVLDRGLDVILVHPERFLYSNGNKKLLQEHGRASGGTAGECGYPDRLENQKNRAEAFKGDSDPASGNRCS